MLITNHVMAGALIGSAAPGPASAFVAGVVSHAVMDAIPHWGDRDLDEAGFLRVAVPDGLVGLAALVWLARRTPREGRVRVVAGMLGACFPDSDKPGRLFLGRSPFPAVVDQWHDDIQHEDAWRMPQEVALATAGLLLARRAVARAGRSRARG